MRSPAPQHSPQPARRVAAHDTVAADRGRVALQRGPIVSAADWPDNLGGHVRNLLLPDDSRLTSELRPDLLNGVVVVVVKGKAVALAHDERGNVPRHEQELTAIPYYAWANRGPGEMVVWIPNHEPSARPQPVPTAASSAKLATSGGQNPRAINDQEQPRATETRNVSLGLRALRQTGPRRRPPPSGSRGHCALRPSGHASAP